MYTGGAKCQCLTALCCQIAMRCISGPAVNKLHNKRIDL